MTPDVLPVLSKGKHRSPRRGACFMEFASMLAGERFSDHPPCTHPMLAAVARTVNDCTTDEGRPLLAPLVPSVIGSAYDDPRIAPALARLCCETALRHAPGSRRFVLAVGLLAAERAMASVDDAPGPSRASSLLSQDETAAARRFVRGMRGSQRYYQRRGARRAAEYAVVSIAAAPGPATDEVLRDLLARAVEVCRRIGESTAPAAQGTPAGEAWNQACERVGVAP